MSTITTRAGKGSPLTNNEVDANFTNLNNDKLESADLSGYAELTGATFTGDVEGTEFIGSLRGNNIFKAKAGEALSKGDAVYISGISGNTPVVSLADADSAGKMPAFGLASDDASANSAVDIVTYGQLTSVDTSAFSLGDTLYVSNTPGQLTSAAPSGESSLVQNLGKVERVHATAGILFVAGAGRTNATPNLNDGQFFLGNVSNQAVSADFTTSVLGEISAGTGIGISASGVISNTDPDQTVSLTGATGISTSGTYPNFTITNDSPDQTVSLTGAGATSISGTYPNFTISSTDSNTTYTAGTGITLSGTTFSLTDTNAKLNLTGGTLTGALSGTTATFSGNVNAESDIRVGTAAGAINQTGVIKENGSAYGLGLFTWGDTAPVQIGGGSLNLQKESGGGVDLKINGTTVIDSSRNITATRFRSANGTIAPLSSSSTFSNVFTSEDSATRVAYFDGNGGNASVWWGNGSNAHAALDSGDGLLDVWVNPLNGSWYNIADFSTSGLNVTTGTAMVGGNAVWHAGNDGSGSGLDADLLDGTHKSGFFVQSGSWLGDLGSNGYTRENGLSMTGGSEFVLLSKNGQGSVLVDGQYISYESSNGFFGSYDSSYGNASGIRATAASTVSVMQLDGGNASLAVTGDLSAPIFYDSNNTGYYVDPHSNSVLNGLGIGISPAAKLHVHGTQSYGSFRLSPTSTNGESAMAFYSDTAGVQTSNAWVIGHAPWGETGRFVIGNQAGGGPLILVDQNGSTGIGIAPNTTQKLVVGGLADTRVQIDGSSTAGVYFTVGGSNGATIRSGSTNNLQFYTSNLAATIDSSLNFTATGSSRAPIFYDSNDTGYYLNPQSTSVLSRVDFGSSQQGWRQYGTHSTSGHSVSSISFDWDSNYDDATLHGIMSTDSAGTYSDNLSINSFNDISMRLDANNNNSTSYFRIYNNSNTNGNERFYLDSNAVCVVPGSFRAPIFYDSNNTGCYVDPASAGISANFAGRIQVGTFAASQSNNGEAWIGRASDRVQGTLSVQLGTGQGRKFEVVDAGWTTVEFSADDSGNAVANSSMRAPIFYDSANTGYFVDPASTSNLYSILMPHLGNGTENIKVNNGQQENWRAINVAMGGGNLAGIGYGNNTRSVFNRHNLAFHCGVNDSIRFHSDGWNTLFEVTGGVGDAWLKGQLQAQTLHLAGPSNTNYSYPNVKSYGSSNSGGVANYHLKFMANNGNANGSISTNYYQTTYATTSDYRAKEDFQPIINATSRLMSLNPVNFQWKDSDMRTDGFLAHEVAEVVSDAVVGEKDAVDEQGNDELQALDQSKLVPLLVKTIQEQQGVIEALEARISALEA